jgi:diguanylate cyclase (GGDEF)-like protein/PAS domain S-box-containing protein
MLGGEYKEITMENLIEGLKQRPMVLIVDDETTARFVTREVLCGAGFDVEEAEDGAVALQMLEDLKPDIIIADVMMPVMDGFTLCEEIRRRPDGKLLPILMVTGLDDAVSIHRAYEVGATDFITKPFNWLVLSQRIRHMIREGGLVQDLRRSEAKNRALLIAIPDMMFRIDGDGTILESRKSKDIHLADFEREVTGKKLYEALPLSVAQSVMGAIENALKNGTTENLEYQLIIEGAVRHFEARIVVSDGNETLCIVRDITDKKTSENALKESEERYALAIEGASDGLWDWDMRTNEIHYSLRWKSMLGWKDDEIGSSPDEWFRRIHPEDIGQFRILLNAHIEGASPHFEVEHRIMHKDGTYLWVLTRGIAVRDETGKPYRMAGSQTDVTDYRRAQDQLFRDAYYDSLTGLANRTLLTNRLEQSLGRAKRSKEETFAILFIDLDRFKNVNDTLGHIAGDKLLIAVGEKLHSSVRPGDTVSRIGGDEFVILLENVTDLPKAIIVTERIEHNLSLPMDIDGQEIFMAASIGIVVASGDYEKPEDVLRDADIAVYRAKAMGRGCHITFDPTMYQKTVALLELESDLRKAVERRELFLHYQPIVSLETGAVVSVEALIRWQHPQRGLVSPGEFIPLAEETGLIVPIGEWVLRKVCEQVSEWRRLNGSSPIVAVNVSGHQLKQADFASIVKEILDHYGLSPDSIELEITETVLMNNLEHTNKVLSELREMGLHLSLDDFGTGYSSLSYLQRFPVQKLKVDRSFILRLGLDSGSSEIVSAILQLAKKLGLDVVAEGVETNQAASRLRAMGYKLAQGFYFARPSEAEDLNLPCLANEIEVLRAG